MIIFFLYELIRVVFNAAYYKKTKAEDDKDEAVKAAVAEALAAKGVSEGESIASEEPAQPAEDSVKMTAEELEQFKKFREFQKMQQAQQEQTSTEETQKNET